MRCLDCQRLDTALEISIVWFNARSNVRSLKDVTKQLEALYACYSKREYVNPDPLQFLYDYPNLRERELVGIIASSLAYGGVKQILASVKKALDLMRPSPLEFLKSCNFGNIERIFKNFKHRFATGGDFSLMLWGIKRTLEDFGSLEAGFMDGYSKEDESVLPALIKFTSKIRNRASKREKGGGGEGNVCYGFEHLLPYPEKGGASKRLHLFLRWMVRKDAVDPGGWQGVPPSKLIVPVDLHMHRIGIALGITNRKQANLKTALEITAAFREIVPEDPVKYDFVLTRLGIRDDTDMEGFLNECRFRS